MKSPLEEDRSWVDELSIEEFEEFERRVQWLDVDARPEQLTPEGDWKTWLLLAGRGFGKTRTAAEDIAAYGLDNLKSRIAVVAETFADGRDTCIEGESGLLGVLPESSVSHWNRSLGELVLTNGTRYKIYSGDRPNQLRGPQFHRAWCLSEGTPVATEFGQRPIEGIRAGDKVLTTKGYRSVLATGVRYSTLVSLALVDGRKITGSPEHPIGTTRGWIPLSEVRNNDRIWAWKDDGTKTLTDTSFGMRAERCSDNTETFGNGTTGPSPKVGKSTTSTVSVTTTELRTCNSLPRKSTEQFTRSTTITSAENAAETSDQRSTTAELTTASLAAGRLVSANESWSLDTVNIAEKSFRPAMETIAVSDVSTSADVGRVHNLQVEGQPEFFANGILTHNCDELAKFMYAEETWTQLQLGLRLGEDPRCIVTTTPRPIPLIRELVERDNVVITTGSTYDNAANLAESFLDEIRIRYEGTDLGEQELHGKIVNLDGESIFKREWWNHNRYDPEDRYLWNKTVARFASLDTANKAKETNAFSALTVGDLQPDYSMPLRYVNRQRLEFPDLVEWIADELYPFVRDGKLKGVCIEDAASGTQLIQTLLRSGPAWLRPLIVPVKPKGKEDSWRAASVWTKRQMMPLPEPSDKAPWLSDYEAELFSVPNSQFKDQADSTCMLINYVEESYSAFSTRWQMIGSKAAV